MPPGIGTPFCSCRTPLTDELVNYVRLWGVPRAAVVAHVLRQRNVQIRELSELAIPWAAVCGNGNIHGRNCIDRVAAIPTNKPACLGGVEGAEGQAVEEVARPQLQSVWCRRAEAE